MRHASLFSGIGGFDLAASWMGWENVFQVEINPFCQKILEKNFPNVRRYADIKELDGEQYRETIDLLSGGFPCQPYSSAGKRKGKDDERHLWPEMLRVIREISPRWVVGENVRGLTNWNGGLVFDEVQADLEAAGYEVTPFLLPAAGVNAPHERYRIWFIAYAGCRISDRRQDQQGNNFNNWKNTGRTEATNFVERLSETRIAANTNDQGLERNRDNSAICRKDTRTIIRSAWSSWPTQPPVCGGNDGIPIELDLIKRIENEQGFYKESIKSPNVAIWTLLRAVWEQREFAKASHRIYADNIYHSVSEVSWSGAYERWNMGQRLEEDEGLRNLWEAFYSVPFEEAQDLQQKLLINIREAECRKKMEQKQRVHRIKALGNAIVPQVVFQIFKAIEQYEHINSSADKEVQQ